MASKWISTTVGEQATLQRGIDITRATQRDGSVPVISSGGISSYHDQAAVKGPGVVLGRKGVVGSVYYVESDFWPHDTTLWVKDFHGNYPRFIYYFFVAITKYISRLDVGSANPTLNRNHLHPLEIVWPDTIDEQKVIAEILGTLDDKIELNRKMNETLEAMARALFQSWFVDFDPVRAKAAVRREHPRWTDAEVCRAALPTLSPEIAALFPDSFENSALGDIPTGWSVMGLDEIARFLNGLALQKYPPIDGKFVPVIKIAQLRAGNTIGADRANADLEPDYLVQDGDILFSWSGSLECVFWAGGLGALNQHLFKVTSTQYPRWLCYLAVHQHLDEFRHIAAGKATTMGHIQRRHLSEAKIAVPPFALLEAMTPVIEPTIESTWRRNVESRTLAALRDTLLPKLISGELRVKTSQSEKSAPAEVCNG